VAGPLVGGLVIHALGVHVVYLIAAILTFSGAWCVSREVAQFARFRRGPGTGVYSTS
jgi:hypothetical protein